MIYGNTIHAKTTAFIKVGVLGNTAKQMRNTPIATSANVSAGFDHCDILSNAGFSGANQGESNIVPFVIWGRSSFQGDL